jgi:hypothetical protein
MAIRKIHEFITATESGVYIKAPGAGRLLNRLVLRYPNLFVRNVPIDKLLLGGENGYKANLYARYTNNLLRPSTSILQSPHLDLLRAYEKEGNALFEKPRFSETDYFRNAMQCIALQGVYFSATDAGGIRERAKQFVAMLQNNRTPAPVFGETPPGGPVTLVRIKYSDCFQIVDGHHRLALAAFQGHGTFGCSVDPFNFAVTPLQQLILESSHMAGKRELYQPLTYPEIAGWPLVRRCDDRLDMMLTALSEKGIVQGTYLDLCSSYGWFVAEMSKRGFSAHGVDQDIAAVNVGHLAYGIDPNTVTMSDVVSYLRARKQRYDIVSCFSIAHHFALGRGSVSAEELIRLVDAVTGSVLFFDTGEFHERWFRESLKEWTPTYIENWLKNNTSFSTIKLLGTDRDDEGAFQGNYGRHLFACYRS